MANFRYKARDRQGRAVSGVLEAPSERGASEELAKQGFIPITVERSSSSAGTDFSVARLFGPEVKLQERNIFTRQLWTLQKAGVPLVNSLNSLREQTKSKAFKRILAQLVRDLESGDAFSTTLSRHPETFDLLFVNMVRAGEASGKLDEVLYHLAEMGEFEAETRERVKTATRYPMITFASLIIAFFGMVTFVIPRFSGLYTQFSSDLPLPTRILLGINHAIRHEWILLILGTAAAVFAFRYLVNTPAGRYRWDYVTLKVPVFGPLMFNIMMSRFTRVLGELLASGVPIMQSLQLVADTVRNSVIRKAVIGIQESVNEGRGMSDPMRRCGLFTPMVYQMVAVGEQSGKTEELLRYVADYYQEQARYMMKNLTTLIEPMLIFVIGGLVTLLALGVFLPLWNMINVVQS